MRSHAPEKKLRIARFRDPTVAGIIFLLAAGLAGAYFYLAPAPDIEISDAAKKQIQAREQAAKAAAAKKDAKKPETAKKPAPPKYSPAVKVAHADGALAFDKRQPDFTVDKIERVANSESKGKDVKTWTGPQDLSMKIWVGHDKDYLVIRADVMDDKHWQKVGESSPSDIFQDDSLQLAFTASGWSSQWEFGFALGSSGRLLRYCWMRPDFKTPLTEKEQTQVLESLDFDCNRIDGGLTYVIRFPLKQLRLSMDNLKHGLRFNAAVNDSDDDKVTRKQHMEITDGITGNKLNTTFAEIKFAK